MNHVVELELAREVAARTKPCFVEPPPERVNYCCDLDV